MCFRCLSDGSSGGLFMPKAKQRPPAQHPVDIERPDTIVADLTTVPNIFKLLKSFNFLQEWINNTSNVDACSYNTNIQSA